MNETNELLRAIVTRLEEMNAEIKVHSKRFDTLEGRFDSLEMRFDKLETRFDTLEAAVKALQTEVKELRQESHERHDYIRTKIFEHDEQIHKLKRRQA